MASFSRSGVTLGPRLSWVRMVRLQAGVLGGLSVCRGAGSTSSRLFSGNASIVRPGLGGGARETGLLSMNEKDTMQNLNDRLAAYLEMVRSLEEANGQLERQIREVYAKRALAGSQDLSGYFSTIAELRSQVQAASTSNAQLILQIDNATLAADDFRVKFESELAIRRGGESDISALRKVLDELTLSKASLEEELESLQEELAQLQKNHGEETAALRGNLGGSVSVEVDSAPGVNLVKTLAEIRDQYKDIIERNRREAAAWHKQQCEMVTQEVATSSAAAQGARTRITELRRVVQGLEIELQSLHSMKEALEGTLAETQAGYGGKLTQLRGRGARKEAELVQLRTDAQRQAEEHQQLLDLKTRLEMEIATYRRLLEGDDVRSDAKSPGRQTPPEPVNSSPTSRRVKTMIEKLLDGTVVSSHPEEVEQLL
ncbi:keratin, type I cytoskeletal 19-like [Chelonoidis abingdonii]|uniref:keratin, type I cytoskeletal 19-like n=1 Tax=Chelonoidis abingdonii TaxID=106734 RepID=UPI0013F23E40|nr:keratin, type I cytoskeletal 47 kDa-like [Chelonoidis abingdonii]